MQEEQNNQQPTEQAGNVIMPGGNVQQPPAATPVPTPPAPAPPEEVPAPEEATDESVEEPDQENQAPAASHQEITWTGSEYIHHQKSANWFLLLFLVSAAAAGLAFLITRDFITSGMILFCAFIFGVFSRREPGQIQYSVSDNGVMIGNKTYDYKQFKSFAVAQEGAIENIVLRPIKRFETLRTIYCAPEQLDDIVEVMSAHIPMDDHSPDAVDKLMHKVRF